MNKGYPLNLRRYRLVRKKDNKYHPAYSHNHVEKEAQLFAGRSKVLSRIAATSIHTENHITNVTNKESKLCNIHGTILLYFTREATAVANASADVPKPNISRGYAFTHCAAACTRLSLTVEKSVPFGNSRRISRFIRSFVPRSHEVYGWQ